VGLVYVAAFAPDKGESVSTLIGGGQQPPVLPSADGFLFFDAAIFPQAFAQDIGPERGAFLAAAQVPTAAAAFATPLSQAAWRSKPSFYVLASEDRIIPPAAQRRMAERANATLTEVRGSHAVYISQAGAVADAIDRAAQAVSR
jgi:pimeloyl-ACP methyl ester carboxylesterase